MHIMPLKIAGAFRIELAPHQDHRGFFVRTYDREVLARHGLVTAWVQESHSFSAKKGTLRGLHIQRPPSEETKLIRAAHGRFFLALLDLRSTSPTFKSWEGVVLSAQEPGVVYTPKGIATGVCTLTDDCSVLYKMDTTFTPQNARTVRWNDPALAIPWPVKNPILSDNDKAAPLLDDFLTREGPL